MRVFGDVSDVSGVDYAFTAFVRSTGSRSLRLAVLLSGDIAAGQDLLQSVHERLYKRWLKVGSPEEPESYGRRALVNGAGKSRRRRSLRPETLMAVTPDIGSYEIGADVALRSCLLPALRRLSRQQRSVMTLRYFTDLTEAETAGLLGCTVGTVKTQASRALRRLRQDPALADALMTMEA